MYHKCITNTVDNLSWTQYSRRLNQAVSDDSSVLAKYVLPALRSAAAVTLFCDGHYVIVIRIDTRKFRQTILRTVRNQD